MPSEAIISRNSRQDGGKTMQGPEEWFTGGPVYIDPCHSTKSNDPSNTTSCATVTFTPGARTNWHWHEKGQLIKVETGSGESSSSRPHGGVAEHSQGWICDKGGEPRRIAQGDTVWCPPDVTHWHGADDDSIMSHFVFALGGVKWYDPVSDEEYARKAK